MHHVIYIYACGVCAVCVSRFFDILQLTVAGVHASTPVCVEVSGGQVSTVRFAYLVCFRDADRFSAFCACACLGLKLQLPGPAQPVSSSGVE
jgi:hypothetical protein